MSDVCFPPYHSTERLPDREFYSHERSSTPLAQSPRTEPSHRALVQSHTLSPEGWCMQDLYACPVQSQRRNAHCRSDCSVTYISAVPRTRRTDLRASISLGFIATDVFEHARHRSLFRCTSKSRREEQVNTAYLPEANSNNNNATSGGHDAKAQSTPHTCASRLAEDTWLSAHLHPTLAFPCLWAVIGCVPAWAKAGECHARDTRILLHRLQRCESGW